MKNHSHFRTSTLLLLYITAFHVTDAADLSVPQSVQQKIADALSTAANSEVLTKNPAAFREALVALNKTVTPELLRAAGKKEGDGINAKLIVIADALALHPTRFAEIDEYYVSNGVENSRIERQGGVKPLAVPVVDFAPSLRPEHATAEYRLVWEAYMLIPWLPQGLQFFPELVNQTLREIADPRSVPVVEYAYKAASTNSREDPNLFTRLLLEIPSEASLRALLTCGEEWAKQKEVRKAAFANSIPGLGPDESLGDISVEIANFRVESPTKVEAWKRTVEKGKGGNAVQTLILQKIRVAFLSK